MKSNALKIAVNVAFGAVWVLLMASAVVEEVPHEWLGIAAFALFAAHQVLNRAWWARLFKGRYHALRRVQTVVNLALVACLLGQIVSSLILSKHAFGFLPVIPGASWARVVHLVCSYGGFLLMAAHAGLHVQPLARKLAGKPGERSAASVLALWAARAIFATVACFGAWSFAQLDLASYLSLQVQFAFADDTVPFMFSVAQYAAIAVLAGGIAHYAVKPLRPQRVRTDAAGGLRSRSMSIPRGRSRSITGGNE